MKFKKALKDFVFPITLLTIITFIGIIVSFHALYIAFTTDPIYAVIVIPITIFLIFFYIIDRFLVKKVSYYKLIIGEIIIGIVIYVIFSYQDSYTDINFHTNQDYVLVIFNSEENSISKFNRKGLFGKELDVYNTNKIHLDITMSLRKNLRINEPKEWKGTYYKRGKYEIEGDSIEYIYCFKQNQITNYLRQSDTYID
ncbi:hypothetical protein ACFLSU_09060, partial [Bacteroidota bacterium]